MEDDDGGLACEACTGVPPSIILKTKSYIESNGNS